MNGSRLHAAPRNLPPVMPERVLPETSERLARGEIIVRGLLVTIFILGAVQNAGVYNLPTAWPCTFEQGTTIATEQILITPNLPTVVLAVRPVKKWGLLGGRSETCAKDGTRYLLATDASGQARVYQVFPRPNPQPFVSAELGTGALAWLIYAGLLVLQAILFWFKKEELTAALAGCVGRPEWAEDLNREAWQLKISSRAWMLGAVLLLVWFWFSQTNVVQVELLNSAWLVVSEAGLGAWSGGLFGLLLGGLIMLGTDAKKHPLSELKGFFYWGALLGSLWLGLGVFGS